MSVQVRLLGGFGVVRDDVPVAADAWGRRQAAQLVQLARAHPRPPAAPRAGDRRLVARAVLRRPPLLGCTRRPTTPAAPSTTRTPSCCARSWSACSRVATTSRSTSASSAAPPARPCRPSDPTLAAEALGWYAGPLLPEDPYEPWTDEPREAAQQQHLDLLRLLGRWDDAARRGARGRGGAPRAGPGARRRRRRPRRAASSSSGSSRRCTGSSVPRPDPEAVRLRERARAEPATAGRTATRPSPPGRLAGGPSLRAARRGRPGPRRPRRGRRRTRRHRAGRGSRRGGQVGRARPGRGAGPPAGLEGGARGAPRRSRARGPTRRCWRRSAPCAVVTRRCWTGWATTTAPRSSRP